MTIKLVLSGNFLLRNYSSRQFSQRWRAGLAAFLGLNKKKERTDIVFSPFFLILPYFFLIREMTQSRRTAPMTKCVSTI